MSTRGGGRSINLWWGVTGSNGVRGSLAAIGFLGRYNSCRIGWCHSHCRRRRLPNLYACLTGSRKETTKTATRKEKKEIVRLLGVNSYHGYRARKVFGRGKRTVEMIETFSSVLFFLLSENFLSLWYYQMWFMLGLKGCFRWKVLSIILILYNVNVDRCNILKYQI